MKKTIGDALKAWKEKNPESTIKQMNAFIEGWTAKEISCYEEKWLLWLNSINKNKLDDNYGGI